MTNTLDLLPREEEQLHQLAAQQGISTQELVLRVIKRLLERPQAGEEVVPVGVESFSHTFSTDRATELDNEQVDADLSREYGNNRATASKAVILGEEGCHAGVFIYKDDSRVEEALQSLQVIADQQMVRGELHKTKEGFIRGIRKWNSQLEDDNAYLCVYAHMGVEGIGCGIIGASQEDVNASIITWNEIAAYLPKKFEMIWLLGCKSNAVLEEWKDRCPTKYLFVTSESKNYVDFLKLFAAEVTFNPITPYNEMPAYLAAHSPDLAKHTKYYMFTSQGYKQVFTPEDNSDV